MTVNGIPSALKDPLAHDRGRARIRTAGRRGASDSVHGVNPVASCIIQICLAAGFTALGISVLVKPARWAEEFRKLGEVTFGRKVSDAVYQPGNLKWAAIWFVIIGPIFAITGIVRLATVVAGA